MLDLRIRWRTMHKRIRRIHIVSFAMQLGKFVAVFFPMFFGIVG